MAARSQRRRAWREFLPEQHQPEHAAHAQDATIPPSQQVNGLNRVRFTADPSDDTNTAIYAPPLAAISSLPAGTGSVRPDFTFINQEEAVWRMMGSRLANPGYYAVPTSTPGNRYNPISH